jgi:hypothetical protein
MAGNNISNLIDNKQQIAYPDSMNESRSLSDLSVTELRKVLQIKEEIATLENQLEAVLGAPSAPGAALIAATPAAKPAAGKRGRRRKLSPEARERIAAAQRARWAARRGGTPAAAAKPAPGKRGGRRKLSPEARERIAAAQRARWAARRGGTPVAKPAADKPAADKPAADKPAPSKRGGRRKLSPEARERIAAAQRARWAAVRKAS